MEKMGLCNTCVHSAACIFDKKQPILQCEEFFAGDNMIYPKFKHKKSKKSVFVNEIVADE